MFKNFDAGKWNYNIALIYTLILKFDTQESENRVDNFYSSEQMVNIVMICTTNDRHNQYSNSSSGKSSR